MDQTREVNRSAVTSFLKLAEALAAPRPPQKVHSPKHSGYLGRKYGEQNTKIGAETCA